MERRRVAELEFSQRCERLVRELRSRTERRVSSHLSLSLSGALCVCDVLDIPSNLPRRGKEEKASLAFPIRTLPHSTSLEDALLKEERYLCARVCLVFRKDSLCTWPLWGFVETRGLSIICVESLY